MHSHHATLTNLSYFLAGYDPPEVIFTQNMKNEHYQSDGEKQRTLEKWEKAIAKVRTYEIPNEFFIVLERISQLGRMLIERGHLISIGMKWSRGGVDWLAKRLGVAFAKEWRRKFGDGDIDGLDQSIHYIFLQFFYQAAGMYFKRGHPDYPIMMRIINFLARVVSVRCVRFFARLWAMIVGKMPSGCWMTSHGNSWIVIFWFFLFGNMQIARAPLEKRAEMEAQLIDRIILMIVYGDDHILSSDRNETSEYFNTEQFAQWCKTYLNVSLRDVRPDVPFVIEARSGERVTEGIVYLKHFFVRNKRADLGQSKYLPFRPIAEYQMKAVWGRECKDRDIYDFLLSLLGHSYGTYASNFPAYLWLCGAFNHAIKYVETSKGGVPAVLGQVKNRAHTNSDFMKKMRQNDLTIDDISHGFPTWETLVRKNQYDEVYHQSIRNDFVPV